MAADRGPSRRDIRDADDSTGDWIERIGPDGKSYRVVNHDNIRRSKLQIQARHRLISRLLITIHPTPSDDGLLRVSDAMEQARRHFALDFSHKQSMHGGHGR